MTKGYWTTDRDEKEALVETSWRAGHSSREIAHALMERFGGTVTRNMVVGKVSRLGLPMHKDCNAWRGFDKPQRRKA